MPAHTKHHRHRPRPEHNLRDVPNLKSLLMAAGGGGSGVSRRAIFGQAPDPGPSVTVDPTEVHEDPTAHLPSGGEKSQETTEDTHMNAPTTQQTGETELQNFADEPHQNSRVNLREDLPSERSTIPSGGTLGQVGSGEINPTPSLTNPSGFGVGSDVPFQASSGFSGAFGGLSAGEMGAGEGVEALEGLAML